MYVYTSCKVFSAIHWALPLWNKKVTIEMGSHNPATLCFYILFLFLFFTTRACSLCLPHRTTWLDASNCSTSLTAAISQAPPPATASMQLSPPTSSCGCSQHTVTITGQLQQLVEIVTKDKRNIRQQEFACGTGVLKWMLHHPSAPCLLISILTYHSWVVKL